MQVKLVDPRQKRAALEKLRFDIAATLLPGLAKSDFECSVREAAMKRGVIPDLDENGQEKQEMGVVYHPGVVAGAAMKYADVLIRLNFGDFDK